MNKDHFSLRESGFLSPGEVIPKLGLSGGEHVLDFGVGSGYWAILLAKAIGRGGHVFVTDTNKESLSVVKAKAEKMGLVNISYHEGPYKDKIFPIQTKMDFILIANIFSETKDTESIFSLMEKLSQEGTRMLVVDWKKESPIGPKKEKRIDEEDVILKAKKSNFIFKRLVPVGAYHTGLFFVYSR